MMRSKTIYLTLLLLAIGSMLIAACSTPSAFAQTGTQLEASSVRTLSVSGQGTVRLAPDIAYVFIGVHTEQETPGDAVEANNEQAQAVIDALLAEGIAETDIQTTNFNIYPMEEYDFNGQRTGVTAYVVDNTVQVTVRDLDSLGDLLSTAISAGANSINGIQFDVGDKDRAFEQARELAVENGFQQAEALADLSGVTLGEIQNIVMFAAGAPGPYYPAGVGGGASLVAEERAVPVLPGELAIQVQVSMTFEIQ